MRLGGLPDTIDLTSCESVTRTGSAAVPLDLRLAELPLSSDEFQRRLTLTKTDRPSHAVLPVWSDRQVLPSCCPSCGAPLSVRRWLGYVDCWNCGLSIAMEFVGARQFVAPVIEERWRQPDEPSHDYPPLAAATPALTTPVLAELRTSVAGSPKPLVARPPRRARRRKRAMPAWLSSLLFHLLLLLILALITLHQRHDPRITLALEVGKEHRPGDQVSLFSVDEERFDLPIPEGDRPRNQRQRQALLQANADARELRVELMTDSSLRPDLSHLMNDARSDDVQRRALIFRDPRLRTQLIRKEGGTTLTEAAVARGLRWLARQQQSDGSWGLDGRRARQAGTSLALLPFLGAGQTHLAGMYSSHVASGLRYLLDQQKPNGDLRGDSPAAYGMYVHGQAAIVLCEAYAMTQDERLRKPAQLAIDFIVEAQHPRGGWRYAPREPGDTSVLGWQLMALQSARAAGLNVPSDTLDLVDQYLESVQSSSGALYAYQPGHRPTHVMTAEALLCRIYLGWGADHPGLRLGTDQLLTKFPPDMNDPDFYYWYYATQVFHHVGGRPWRQWNQAMREALVAMQRTSGFHAGSWDPDGPHASTGGRIYVTSLAICTLEIYYRHAPIFRQIDLRMP